MEEERYFNPNQSEDRQLRILPIVDHVSLYPSVQFIHTTMPEQLTQEDIDERWKAIADLQKEMRRTWSEIRCDSNRRVNNVDDLYI